jgi:hypothetical protein
MKRLLKRTLMVIGTLWLAAALGIFAVGFVQGISGGELPERVVQAKAAHAEALRLGIVDDLIRANAAANPCRLTWYGNDC